MNLKKQLREILFLSCIIRFRDPEPVCKDEIDEAKEAAQGRPGQELLNESFMVREPEQLTK